MQGQVHTELVGLDFLTDFLEDYWEPGNDRVNRCCVDGCDNEAIDYSEGSLGYCLSCQEVDLDD